MRSRCSWIRLSLWLERGPSTDWAWTCTQTAATSADITACICTLTALPLHGNLLIHAALISSHEPNLLDFHPQASGICLTPDHPHPEDPARATATRQTYSTALLQWSLPPICALWMPVVPVVPVARLQCARARLISRSIFACPPDPSVLFSLPACTLIFVYFLVILFIWLFCELSLPAAATTDPATSP